MADELHSSCGTQVMQCCDDSPRSGLYYWAPGFGFWVLSLMLRHKLAWALPQKFGGQDYP